MGGRDVGCDLLLRSRTVVCGDDRRIRVVVAQHQSQTVELGIPGPQGQRNLCPERITGRSVGVEVGGGGGARNASWPAVAAIVRFATGRRSGS